MEEFLRSCRRTLQENLDRAGPDVHVVLGNEACDVDSMVSAMAFAYFLFKTAGNDLLVLPLMNIRQSDLALRSDSVFLLRRAALPQHLLLFRDQLDLRALRRAGRLRLSLVDHNVLPSSDADLEGAVVEVLDHHQAERTRSPTCPVTVEMVGSCATLVTERIIKVAPQILDQQLAFLLYATVVLDCVNMAAAAGKVTPKDSCYVAELEARFPSLPPRGALFQELQKAKLDVSGLNMEQMLIKDMKAVSGSLNVAVPVIYLSLEELLQRAELEAELSAFCHKSGFDLLLMMTMSFTEREEPIRELAVFSHSSTCREQVSSYLQRAQSPALGLSPAPCLHPLISAFHQGNALASRKKLLPLVQDFLRECDGADCLGDAEEEPVVPPTPTNSLVDGCPLDGGLPRITAEELRGKFDDL
ncbi:exopolyphosphatase PRUNE1 [Xiphophorus maculatus]|uniref:Prune exopolyphosphatase n=1 Tax=Xiphophorus maculatus TaxID=8083 RepID=A0A3B5PWI0_XIPMA|nr:exopolyphosphatase PRUNE1 [Xiphophorus maculatus]